MTMTTDEPTTTSPTTTVDTSATEPTTDGPTTDATTTESTSPTEPTTTTETTTTTDPTDTTGETTSTTDPTDATTTESTGPVVDPDCGLGDGPDFDVVNDGFVAYEFNGSPENNPAITVVRGCSYTFSINALNHPFLIKSAPGNGVANTYNDGVTNNGEDVGDITWDVPLDAPDDLFYNCQVHIAMGSTITVIDG